MSNVTKSPKRVADEMLQSASCKHNGSAQKSCAKPSGGESCCFDGAYIVLNPIRDAAHLIHGSIACCGHSYEGRGSKSSGSKLWRTGFTTDLGELDVIYGGEEKLAKAIRHIAERYAPPVIFVYTTCVPGLTGEDVTAVCKSAESELGLRVIAVPAPGFLGHKNLGNRIAGDVLLNEVIGHGDAPLAAALGRYRINLIGEYNIAGELWGVLPLFEELGIEILSVMTGDADYAEIARAHHADANLLICGRALVNVAEGMESRWGIPYREGSFFGIENLEALFRSLAEIVPIDRLFLEERLSAWRQTTQSELFPYKARLYGHKAVVYTGGVKSWSILAALRELGVEIIGCGTKKSSQADIEKIEALIGKDAIIDDITPKKILKVMQEKGGTVLVAGGRNQYLAYKEKIPFLDVNQEKHTPYTGYRGIVQFAADLVKTIEAPAWEIAARRAPWES